MRRRLGNYLGLSRAPEIPPRRSLSWQPHTCGQTFVFTRCAIMNELILTLRVCVSGRHEVVLFLSLRSSDRLFFCWPLLCWNISLMLRFCRKGISFGSQRRRVKSHGFTWNKLCCFLTLQVFYVLYHFNLFHLNLPSRWCRRVETSSASCHGLLF